MEQFLSVTAGDFNAVGVADGSLVEPAFGLNHILERVVDRVQDAVGTDFRITSVSACVRKLPLVVM